MSVVIKGIPDVTRRLNSLRGIVRLQAKDRIKSAALDVQRKAKQKVNVDTGRLRSSIFVADTSISGLQVEVGSNVEYASEQEFAQHGKPYLRPAIEEVKPKLNKELKSLLK